ncbi:MAG: SpoIIE family protein phosphatase [Candidatus Omnitrophota bacterium]
MTLRSRGITFKLVVSILLSSLGIFVLVFGYNYLVSRRIIIKQIEDNARSMTLEAVNRIESVLNPVEKVPEHIAYFLELTSVNSQELLALLRTVILNNSEIYGSTIAFAQYAFTEDVQYFAPYFHKGEKGLEFTDLGKATYRYTEWDWYRIPKQLGRPVWSEPYYDEGGGNILMSTYSVPFYGDAVKKQDFKGVITADVSLAWLEKIVASIKIGKTGYGFLVSKTGRIVTHPRQELIMKETIFSLASLRRDARFGEIGQDMIAGKTGFVSFEDTATGRKLCIAYAPLPSTGWSLAVVFPRDEIMADVTALSRTVIALALAGGIFLLAVIMLVSNSIIRPLRVLDRVTRDIAEGNLDFEVPRVRSNDEVGRLTSSFVFMRGALKKYIKELTQTTIDKERMKSELKIAHSIQMGILPKKFPPFPERDEFDIYAVLEPAREVGGDFYDFFFIDDERVCFVAGDVSGKGVPAALFMTMTKMLIKVYAGQFKEPDKTMAMVNKELSRDNGSCMFVTIFCAMLDLKTGELCYTNGGHNSPVIMRAGKRRAEYLPEIGGPAVGVIENASYEKAKLVLAPGDMICVYTDGITEAFDGKGAMFGDEGLEKAAAGSLPRDGAKGLVERVLHEVKLFTGDTPMSDDMTILALEYFHRSEKRTQNKNKKKIIITNRISEIRRVSDLVTGFWKENGLPLEALHDVDLVLEEVIVNIISYAYDDKNEHEITLSIGLRGRRLFLEIKDSGRPFNPLEAPAPDIKGPVEKRGPGGLGIHLVRSLMDEVKYERRGAENLLIMEKLMTYKVTGRRMPPREEKRRPERRKPRPEEK